MHRIETQIEINASPQRVWSLLTNFGGYAGWNPFVRSIEGRPVVGEMLDVFVQPPGAKGMRFQPTVLVAQPERELRWKGKALMPGLFDGEHIFLIEAKGDGVVFHQNEIFSGVLVPFFKRSIDGATRNGFVAMNEALKREAERRSVTAPPGGA